MNRAGASTTSKAGDGIVFVVDDDHATRRWLQIVLSERAARVEVFPSAEQLLADAGLDEADCIVVDLRLKGMSGLELQRELAARAAAVPVLFISGLADLQAAVEAMRLGAADFLEKPVDPDALLARVSELVEASRNARRERAERRELVARLALLSPREREVVALMVEGLSSKQIARRLNVTTKTIANHRASINRKTGVANVAELSRIATLAELWGVAGATAP